MLTHGSKVTLHNNTYNTHVTGTLHLPNMEMYEPATGKTFHKPGTLTTTPTIILPNGNRYRTEGYLTLE